MGRKRAFGDDASSEDDFFPSDASASPPSSRLKRKRRTSSRSRVASRNNTQSNDARQQPQVICIPESPEAEEVVPTSVQQSPPLVDGVTRVPNLEEHSQGQGRWDREGGEEGERGAEEGEDGDSIEEVVRDDGVTDAGVAEDDVRGNAFAENVVRGKLVSRTGTVSTTSHVLLSPSGLHHLTNSMHLLLLPTLVNVFSWRRAAEATRNRLRC